MTDFRGKYNVQTQAFTNDPETAQFKGENNLDIEFDVDKLRQSPRINRSTSDMMASPYEPGSSVQRNDLNNEFKRDDFTDASPLKTFLGSKDNLERRIQQSQA